MAILGGGGGSETGFIREVCAWLGSGLNGRLRGGWGRYLRRKRGVTFWERQCLSGYKEECGMQRRGMARWAGGQQRWEEKREKPPNPFEAPS